MITFSVEELRDRIFACWLGKNIGGTLGTPYEGTRELLDITGFASKAGEPLPNDDLDLQLAWLRAVDELGPQNINSKTLGEYWLSYVTPNWNEYGVGKANMRDALLPPLSGQVNNEAWMHSNGAWIRIEVWACLYPAKVEQAIRMAYEDASVDHGFGEGTYAAIFVAAIESAAFAIRDARRLLEIGLSKIPEDCRVARSVRTVLEAYDKGTPWRETRRLLVEDSDDLGWFQAPANIGFVVLGLLYGEGDFKKSLIYAVNCGDDTDCTGATLGAILGIMGGKAALPEDWCAYIGEGIRSICLTNGHGPFPVNCTELTDCIMSLLPTTLRRTCAEILAGTATVMLGESTDISEATAELFTGRAFVDSLQRRKPYSYVIEGVYADVLVEFDGKPVIEPLGTLSGRVTILRHTLPEPKHYRLTWLLPEGWQAQSARNLFTTELRYDDLRHASTAFTLTAGERVDAVNQPVLQVSCAGRPTQVFVPVTVMG